MFSTPGPEHESSPEHRTGVKNMSPAHESSTEQRRENMSPASFLPPPNYTLTTGSHTTLPNGPRGELHCVVSHNLNFLNQTIIKPEL